MRNIIAIEGFKSNTCKTNNIQTAFIGITYQDNNYNYMYLYNGKLFNDDSRVVSADIYIKEKFKVNTLGWVEELNKAQIEQITGLTFNF